MEFASGRVTLASCLIVGCRLLLILSSYFFLGGVLIIWFMADWLDVHSQFDWSVWRMKSRLQPWWSNLAIYQRMVECCYILYTRVVSLIIYGSDRMVYIDTSTYSRDKRRRTKKKNGGHELSIYLHSCGAAQFCGGWSTSDSRSNGDRVRQKMYDRNQYTAIERVIEFVLFCHDGPLCRYWIGYNRWMTVYTCLEMERIEPQTIWTL